MALPRTAPHAPELQAMYRSFKEEIPPATITLNSLRYFRGIGL